MIPIAKPYLTTDEASAAYDTILTGWITQGPQVAAFEEKFANYVGAAHAVALSNCTTALHLALLVAGIQAGDEVICPSMTYIATANAIKYVNATPVFAEVGSDYNISIEDVRKKITPKTKAIIIVHQIGMPADIDGFKALCKEFNLQLIEDAACAIGSEYKGQKIGSHSDLVCFSFHPRKVISTGDGGMISTGNKAYADRLRLLRQHGMSINDRVRHNSTKVVFEDHIEIGYNYRMTDIQAAVGIKQLEKLDLIVGERRKIAQFYEGKLAGLPMLRLPLDSALTKSNFQSFSVFIDPTYKIDRNDLMQYLLDKGIASRRGIMCVHRETAYQSYNLQMPISETLQDNSILLPLYYPMKQEDLEYVIETFITYLKRN